MDLMTKFADPTLINQMSLSEKIYASLFTTGLGMLITFAALIVLWGLTALYSKMIQKAEAKKAEIATSAKMPEQGELGPVQSVSHTSVKPIDGMDPHASELELIAVITAAVASSLGTPAHAIVVHNINRVPDTTPAWGQAGRILQMNTRF